MKYADIVYKIYLGHQQEYYSDMQILKNIWHDLSIMIINYTHREILSILSGHMSDIFIAILHIRPIYKNIINIMENVLYKIENIKIIRLVYANIKDKSEAEKYIKIEYKKYKIIEYMSKDIIGGWILLDEQCNLIDRSFGFLNFVK